MSGAAHDPGDVVRHASDALVAVGKDRRILSMNPSAETLTGWPEAEAVGELCSDILRASVCGDRCPFERYDSSPRRVRHRTRLRSIRQPKSRSG
ncbi:MAG: PAS domain-containing protein [bacterium]|nr:PAS domain-containing protein [bacterium]